MLDKRRFFCLPSCTVVFLISLLFIGVFSIWYLNGFSEVTVLNFTNDLINSKYLIISPKNHSDITQTYFLNKLPRTDKLTLIDLKNFEFLINHETCNKTPPFLLILIHSAPGNLIKRNVIRETWGQKRSQVAVFFLTGSSEKYNSKLKDEDKLYNDLIQGNFIDAYRNMTYKHVMALKWVSYSCPNARYVLKLDDDVFVNVPALMEFLNRGLPSFAAKRLILCDTMSNLKVKRSWRSKWRVSPKEYSDREYPPYCGGWAILYSIDTVFLLYQEAQKEPYFWIDDVHVTGTLAKKANVTHVSIKSMILNRDTMKVVLEKSDKIDFFFGPPDLKESRIRALYNAVTNNVII